MKKWVAKIQKWALDFVVKQHLKWITSNGKEGVRLSFENRHIPYTIFHRTNMVECEFNHADLNGSTFFCADIEGGIFKHTNLKRSNFDQADMTMADVSTTNLRQVTHQIHIRNRQKEDMIKIFDALDRMEEGDQKYCVQRFLRENFIQRPRVH